jgi:hypothetical protein
LNREKTRVKDGPSLPKNRQMEKERKDCYAEEEEEELYYRLMVYYNEMWKIVCFHVDFLNT